ACALGIHLLFSGFDALGNRGELAIPVPGQGGDGWGGSCGGAARPEPIGVQSARPWRQTARFGCVKFAGCAEQLDFVAGWDREDWCENVTDVEGIIARADGLFRLSQESAA